MKIHQSLFLKFLWDERILFSPAVREIVLACSETAFQWQTPHHWGFCVTAPEQPRAERVGCRKRCFVIHKVCGMILYLSPMGSLTGGTYILGRTSEIPMFCARSSGKPHGKGLWGLARGTRLQIVVSRIDAWLLNC